MPFSRLDGNTSVELRRPDTKPIRAAQYLRMSTTNQLYSLANQQSAIAKYAEQHNFVVVQTYTDRGRSGLTIRGRPGLTALLRDVVGTSRRFDAILVYDVSRWGRFQDNDEAAHYEFLCRRSGIPVHYCAEQFTNDMAPPNMIMKALKRTMAAEYSRELSAKVYDGMKRIAQTGCCLGSFPGYGLRHMLVGEDGKPKQLLRYGEHKSLRTERVAFAPGPSEEISVVRLIYRLLLRNKMRPKAITRELARRGITRYGQPWRYHNVREVLLNPKYAGTMIWGRTAGKLKSRLVRLPKREWVSVPDAFQGIVSRRMFARAQKVLHDCTINKTNRYLLNALRRLLARNRYLSHRILEAAPAIPSARTYRSRFGGMTRAYELVGYRHDKDLMVKHRVEAGRQLHQFRAELMNRLHSMFQGRIQSRREPGRQLHLRLKCGVNVAVMLSRARRRSSRLSWYVWPARGHEKWVTLLCLLDESCNRVCAHYVLPGLGKTKGFRVREGCDFLLRGKRLHNLREFYRAAVEAERQLPASERERTPEMLLGLQEVARFLGRSRSTVYRAIRAGMPVVRQAQYITASPEELTRWAAGRRLGNGWLMNRPDRQLTPDMLLGLQEVARFFGRSLGTIHRAIKAGMPVVRQGRFVTAWPNDLLRWTRSEHCTSGLRSIEAIPLPK